MNRNEAIEKAAQLFLQVLEHNDNRLTDSVLDSINGLREALALPEDAEPMAWMHEDGRVVSANTMNGARRDGGAILAGLSGYLTPLYAHPPQAEAERVALRDAMKRNDLIGRIDEVGDGENLEILLRDIRAYLGGDA